MDSTCVANVDDSFGTILCDSMWRFWEVLKRLWPIYLLVFLPMNAFSWVVSTALEIFFNSLSEQPEFTNLFTGVSGTLNAFVGFLAIVATIRTVRDVEEGRDVGWTTVLRESLGRWAETLAVAFLFGLACMFLFCFCVVPSIIFGVFFVFSVHAVALGDCGIIESLKQSKDLVTGKWWWTALLVGVLSGIAGMAAYSANIGFVLGRIPLVVSKMLQYKGTDVPFAVTVVAYFVDFFSCVVFFSLAYVVQCFPLVGQSLLFLRRKAARERGASGEFRG